MNLKKNSFATTNIFFKENTQRTIASKKKEVSYLSKNVKHTWVWKKLDKESAGSFREGRLNNSPYV